MAYVYSSGNEIVDSLRGIEFTGNIIPNNWYKTITNDKGKPDLTAIVILADILYWYRPTIVRAEGPIQEEYLTKKFKDPKYLQRNYSQIETQFGVSKRSARNAVVRLESLGVIERKTKNIISKGGTPLNNVMYLKLNVPKLLELTFPTILPLEGESSLKAEILNNFDITNKRGIPVQKKRDSPPIKEGGVSKISETNTKNTTETTTEILQQDLNLIELPSSPIILSTKELERKIKENISMTS